MQGREGKREQGREKERKGEERNMGGVRKKEKGKEKKKEGRTKRKKVPKQKNTENPPGNGPNQSREAPETYHSLSGDQEYIYSLLSTPFYSPGTRGCCWVLNALAS